MAVTTVRRPRKSIPSVTFPSELVFGKEVRLTERQASLLNCLHNNGEVEIDDICRTVFQRGRNDAYQALRKQVSLTNRRLKAAGVDWTIRNVRGYGYELSRVPVKGQAVG